MRFYTSFLQTIFCLLLLNVCPCWAGLHEEETIQVAVTVLEEMTAVALPQISNSLLSKAYGIAIIPKAIKGGFIVGARHGNGVLMVRDKQNNWQAPVFISLTGGNIGWQIGVQSTDIVLIFTTPKSVQGLLSGTFTIGADAAVAAGPVGRQASAATDACFQAEILSYSKSRGVFVGVSIDGSVIRIDQRANASYYQNPANGPTPTVPKPAALLVEKVSWHTRAPLPDTRAQAAPTATPGNSREADRIRNQLAQNATELYKVLDTQWQAYLSLPAEVLTQTGHPSSTSLTQTLNRFETINSTPRFRALASQPGFQATYGLLKQYFQVTHTANNQLNLPPPPGTSHPPTPGSRLSNTASQAVVGPGLPKKADNLPASVLPRY